MKRLLLLLMALCSLTLHASKILESESGPNSVASVSDPYISSDSIMSKSLIVFDTEVNKTGEYYLLFRVLPAWLNNSHFTTFEVYVDTEKVGTISPRKHGWQNLGIDGNIRVKLSKGPHIIRLALPFGTPINVEEMLVVESNPEDYTDSPEYDRFFEECTSGKSTDFMESIAADLQAYDESGEFENLSMKYTFYCFLELKGGEELLVETYSNMSHAVDLVYWGYTDEWGIIPGLSQTETQNDFEQPKDPFEGPFFIKATQEEKAGYTWTGVSIYNGAIPFNDRKHYIKKYILVPRNGRYYLRARGVYNPAKSVGTISVTSKSCNGVWENVPLTNSYKTIYLPAERTYTCYTKCTDPQNHKPIMFMEMYLGNIIQNYATTFQSGNASSLGCSNADVCCYAASTYPMGVISVNSRVSKTPESTYTLFYELGDVSITAKKNIAQSMEQTQSEIVTEDNTVGLRIEKDRLIITICEIPSTISVYDIQGKQRSLLTLNETGEYIVIPLSDLGMDEKGVYVIRLDWKDGVKTIKVII